ncbi:MAG: DNA polymerase I [Thermodesulfobacteriota bacterium]
MTALKTRMGWKEEPLYLIDGSAYIYKAFYAYPDLKRSDGFPTNALYIVTRLLVKLLNEEQPRYARFFLDGKGPNFRHELLPSYKGQRPKMPEDLAAQIEPLQRLVGILGLSHEVPEGLEADDMIACLTQRFQPQRPIVITGGDKDLNQCLASQVCVWDPSGKQEKVVTAETFAEQYGFAPEIWPDYQALVGDSSDNIPGVPGVGPKTAAKWLKRFPGLEALRDNRERLAVKEQEKLVPHLEDAFTYRQLTRLRTDCCTDSELEAFAVRSQDQESLRAFLQEYEFRSLSREFFQESAARSQPKSNAKISPSSAPLQAESLVDAEVALFPAEQGFILAHDGQEYQPQWPVEKWVQALRNAARVFLPSLKDLLVADTAWEQLPYSICFDCSLGAYLLDPEQRSYDWEKIRQRYQQQLSTHPDNQALSVLEAGQILRRDLQNSQLLPLMRDIELPLVGVLVRMEKRGLCIDLDAFRHFLQEVQDELDQLTQTIYALAGQEFNLRSSQQMAQVLFEDLELPPGRKTPGGVPSTSSQVLEGLRNLHPIIPKILRFRTLEKLRSTYLEPLPHKVDTNSRLHTHFNQLATATGRLSSSGPNLQNIPIRGEFGPRMRQCFVAPNGWRLVAADYSQIELRVLAHLSQDPTLLDAFAQGEDIHRRTAAVVMDISTEKVDAEARRQAKTINFGLLYGMGPQKLSRELNISLNAAKTFIQRYFDRLQGVSAFYETIEESAKQHGYVTTWAGRRRLLPDINSRNTNLAQQARRMAVNTVVQGSAADIIKMAMIQADRDEELATTGARLILQVHDELLLEAPKDNATAAGKRVASLMSSVADMDVPLAVDWGVGGNWAKAH